MASFSKRLIVDASNKFVMTSATDVASEVCSAYKVLSQLQLKHTVKIPNPTLCNCPHILAAKTCKKGRQRVAEADVSKLSMV